MKLITTFLLSFFTFVIFTIHAQPGGYTFESQIGIPTIRSSQSNIKIAPNQSLYLINGIIVQKTDLFGVVSAQWGGKGTGNGKFNNLTDIAADANSNIYVLDAGNLLIQKFDANGVFIKQWSVPSTTNAIYSANGSIYALEAGNSNVVKYSTDGVFIKNFQIYFKSAPSNFCVDAVENFYISQTYEVSKYDLNGVFKKDFGYWTFSGPGEIDIDAANNVYVDDNFDGKINVYTQTSTNFIKVIGSQGTGNGKFQNITTFTFDASGNVFIADNSTTGIQVMSGANVFIRKFNYLDFIGNGHLYRPTCVAVDSESNIYIGDANNLIQKFSPAGVFIKQWGGTGTTQDKFSSIGSISIDANDQIFIMDRGNKLIKQFDKNGNFVYQYNGYRNGVGGVFNTSLNEMEIDKNNHHYILQSTDILKYNQQGTRLRYWGGTGYNDGQFTSPVKELVISNTNWVYVLDNNSISKFDTTGAFISRYYAYNLNTIVAIDNDEILAVASDGTVVKYGADGTFLNSWTMQKGLGMGSFLMIEDIFRAKSGQLFLIDMLNNLVQVYGANSVTTSVFNQQNAIKPLSVYPNPSTGSFKVECSQPIISTRVINLLGETETFYSNEIQTTLRGLLIVESTAADGSICRSKLIVD